MIYPKDIPYLKTLNKAVALPIGHPVGKGNLIFLYSSSLEESIVMINEERNFSNKNRYRWYFLDSYYVGMINGSSYRFKDLKWRLEMYKKISDSTNLVPYTIGTSIKPNESKNTYFDLFKHLQIFNTKTSKYSASKRIQLFWNFIKPILTESYGELNDKYVLINANNYTGFSKGSLNVKINNPLYMIYYTLWKRLDLVNDLDIDFLIYCNGRVLRCNLSKMDKKSYPIFLQEIKKIYAVSTIPEIENDLATELDDSSNEENINKSNSNSVSKFYDNNMKNINNIIAKPGLKVNSVGIKKNPKIKAHKYAMANNIASVISNDKNNQVEIEKKIDATIDKKKKELEKKEEAKEPENRDSSETINKKAEEETNNDKQLISEIYDKMQSETSPTVSDRSSARDKLLRENQKELMIGGLRLSDIQNIKSNDVRIEETNIENNINTTNPNMKKIKFNNFNKTYNENILNKDIVSCFTELNDKSINMYIRNIKIEDTSDELNYKETWTVYLEDENRQRHTIKVDIPKWLENKFLWLGGNRKIIKNQNFFLPIVKIGPDKVLIVSNCNKTTITRKDTKSLRGISIVDKLIEKSDSFKKYFVVGNSFFENHGYLTTLEYDDLSKRFKSFHMKNIRMYFNQEEAIKIAKNKSIKLSKTEIFIGFNGTEPIILDMNTQRDKNDMGITDIILSNLDEENSSIYKKISIPKRLMYTEMTTMKQDIPMGVILCLWEGISKVLKKANIKYHLEDNISELKITEDYIKFANCYLIYDASVPNELLLNGLKIIDTKEIPISSFDTKEAYVPYIEKKFGSPSSINMIMNSYEFTIGHIEREILQDMNLPTDIVSLCIYANNMLCDNDYVNELDQSINRVRCGEIIPSILYDKIAKAYTAFKNSNGKKKLSLPQDAVIKELLGLKTVSDYDSLNPLLELEETHGISSKGFRGINLEKSFSIPKRAYDKSMTGIIAPTSSPDGNVGINRSLSMEPNIKSVRGYADVKDNKLNEVKDVNLFSPAELLIPMGVMTDDAVRTGHSVKQSRHMIPIEKSSPVLISNGSDELCKYYLSTDFVVNAKLDGVVVEKDENTKIMIVEYKDGTHQAINLDKEIVKNGGSGFELSNHLITKLEVGDKFKQNDTLAYHDKFFSNGSVQGTRLNIGPMTKIAICGSYNTYEDCTFITQKLSKECTSEMCFKTAVVIGKNANISQILKEGDTVLAGDPIIQFDESFEDSDINKLLDSLGDDEDLKDAVISNSRNRIKSKYSGTIESIKMYSTVDLDALSPSLKKLFSKYYSKINAKKELLNKYDPEGSVVKCGMLLSEPTGKVEPNRYGAIRGQKVNKNGVLIEFEIKHAEPLEVGSKIADFTALKNVVGEVIDEGYEPYSDFRKDEEIGTFVPPISILSRMTPSIFLNALGNKCLIELKRSLEVIWKKSGDISVKRKEMTNLIYGFFSTFDKSGSNTTTYKNMFEPMSNAKFTSFFKNFFEDDMEYLILNIVDYERSITMDDIENTAKFLHIPIYEHVYIPHLNRDKEHPIVTKEKVPVGYINIKRTQQTIAKKNGLSTNIDKRSAITGQVVRSDKNGRESDLENIMLTSLGLTNTLKELNGPRADDAVMKQQMLQDINTKGFTRLEDLDDRIENKTTLNTVDTYFLGMSLKTDLVTKGLKTIGTIKSE